jgi:hypothetical protein
LFNSYRIVVVQKDMKVEQAVKHGEVKEEVKRM